MVRKKSFYSYLLHYVFELLFVKFYKIQVKNKGVQAPDFL